ncbi:winged helix-turn-helix domain-containing protein, partial [Mesorhizobium sp. ESP7-2]|uniref:winged helix-turn-helix domain-containing protein n=1 Tax=Mesorhizobium sp. ESP7-2 TaxID=2876622 RepID=UPI001CCF9B49
MATDQLSIDLDCNELVDRSGRQVVLRRRSLGLLIHLARNAGHVVSKQELADANWPGLAVTDDSLARCVSDIRSALGPELRRTLRTVSGRGYMLCGWIGDAGGRCLLAPAADHGRPTATDQRPSIAVLPFENLGDDEDAYFADGIAEDIIAAPGLRIQVNGEVDRGLRRGSRGSIRPF